MNSNQEKSQLTHNSRDILNGTQIQNLGGIAIIEGSESFGGGNLQKHFGIKSNTSASGFLKVIMYPKQSIKQIKE